MKKIVILFYSTIWGIVWGVIVLASLVSTPLVAPLIAQEVPEIKINVEQPLGLAFDQSYLWVSDPKAKTISAYDLEKGRSVMVKNVQAAGLRDIAYYKQYLVSVFENRLYRINPNNGNVDEQITLAQVTQGVSLTNDQSLFYIFNRQDGFIYRYDIEKKNFLGKFQAPAKAMRGMSFHRGFLWGLVSDDNFQSVRVAKFSADNGAVMSSFLVANDSYGLTFVNGRMFAAATMRISELQIVETDDYVASSRGRYDIVIQIKASHLWPKEQVVVEAQKKAFFTGFAINAHQRLSNVNVTPALNSFRRNADGLYQAELGFRNQTQAAEHRLKLRATLQAMTYIFNEQNIKKYFTEKFNPEEFTQYLKVDNDDKRKSQLLVDELKTTSGNLHPYLVVASLKQKKMNDADMVKSLRSMGIPARLMAVYDINAKTTQSMPEFFANGVGWVLLTPQYSLTRPREFPIALQYLQMYVVDSLQIAPTPLDEKAKPLPLPTPLIEFKVVEANLLNTEGEN